jgi:hypothetical protein
LKMWADWKNILGLNLKKIAKEQIILIKDISSTSKELIQSTGDD